MHNPWDFGFRHEDEEFLDAGARCDGTVGRVWPTDSVQEGLAEGQQSPFQGQLRGATRCFLGMGAGSGPAVEFQDGVSPLGQWRIIRVEGAQVVDVPQQVDPAAFRGPS